MSAGAAFSVAIRMPTMGWASGTCLSGCPEGVPSSMVVFGSANTAGVVMVAAQERGHRLPTLIPSLFVIAVAATAVWWVLHSLLERHERRFAKRHPLKAREEDRIFDEHQNVRAFGVSQRVPANELADITKNRPRTDKWMSE